MSLLILERASIWKKRFGAFEKNLGSTIGLGAFAAGCTKAI
jgi:hypothetical protein